MTELSRRAFLSRSGQTACVCAGLGGLTLATGQTYGKQAYGKQAAGKTAITPALNQFKHGQVQLAGGPLKLQFDYQHQLFMGLDNDALLKPFRARAGMATPGADMGGWYDNASDFHVADKAFKEDNWHGFIPGHSFGQYVSGLSRDYAITGDPATKTKIELLITQYAETISPKFFDDYNLPAYTYDKLVVGLMDAWYYVGVAQAKPALDRMTDAALPYLPEKALNSAEAHARPHKREPQTWDESYTLPENLFLAWQRGMGERYKALAARYIQDDTYFQPLSEGINPLKGVHAYSHVNGLSSAVQSYLTLGDEKYLRAAKNGFQFLTDQSFATGGWGRNESLLATDDTDSLAKSLNDSHAHFETPCGVYGHFKIARYLLRLTKDSAYGDSMERILYNTILGAKPTQSDGRTFYYSDYNQAATKTYHRDQWPCCSGTFIQLTADYGISAYMFDESSLYVNLYIPSQVQAEFGGQSVVLTQDTHYPATNSSTLTLALSKPSKFALKFRIPAWAGPQTRLAVNGQAVSLTSGPGTFAEVTRTWKNGDKIELSLDMGLRLEPLNKAHPELVALMTGPLVLFPVGDGNAAMHPKELLSARRIGVDDWSATAADREVRLKPFAAINEETYRLYTPLKA